MKFNEITTVADLMTYDVINGTQVIDELMSGVINTGIRELPLYEYDVNSEWFYSDLCSNIGGWMDNPFDYGLQCRSHNEDEVDWDDIRDVLKKPAIAEHMKAEIEDWFRRDATEFLEKRGWIVEHKMSRS